MGNHLQHYQFCAPAYKIEHRHELPYHSVRLELLKEVETELARRGLLPSPESSFFPLWFAAETERNLLLWRSGSSLAELKLFEFWVDVPGLIAKRLKSISSACESRFTPAHFSDTSSHETGCIQQEEQYLKAFKELWMDLKGHLHAMSHLLSELEDQADPPSSRMIVSVPGAASRAK